MEYKIIEGDSALSLAYNVNKEILKGWIPQGGINTIHIDRKLSSISKYYQAMIKVK